MKLPFSLAKSLSQRFIVSTFYFPFPPSQIRREVVRRAKHIARFNKATQMEPGIRDERWSNPAQGRPSIG